MTYGPETLVGRFARLADREPWAPLVVSSWRRATRGEVAALAQSVVRILDPHAEGLVGLSAPNGPAFLAGVLALRATAHGVVLLDPLAPAADRRRACAGLGAAWMLSSLTGWPADAEAWRFDRVDEAVAAGSAAREAAFVKVTSGSTGAPRGVAASEAALLADEAALAASMGLRPDDRIVAAIPMSHSYGFSSVALPALARGSMLVTADDDGPLGALFAAAGAGATVFPSAPAYLQALIRLSQPPAWPESVRLVISASAPLPSDAAIQFRTRFGRSVHVFYGASECGGISYDREGTAGERGTVGEPVEGVRVRLDPVDGDAAEGLVTVESAAVGLGYLPQADERLAGGRFVTSDLGRFEGRELRLRGRLDALINVKGRKVNPVEIEAVLQELPGVEEVVAFGVASADRATDTVRAVIACPSGRLGYDEVLAWCRARLPEHKVPRSIVLVSAIPRTSRGKVSRADLLALAGGHRERGA